jgi:hypothetical protein
MQGRLIPGTSVPSLPFVDAVRSKPGGVGKEPIPEECLSRCRGALFLGPSWAVTRNKLKVRCGCCQALACLVICSTRERE